MEDALDNYVIRGKNKHLRLCYYTLSPGLENSLKIYLLENLFREFIY